MTTSDDRIPAECAAFGLELGKAIGSGAFGCVHAATRAAGATGAAAAPGALRCAVKVIDKAKSAACGGLDRIRDEAALLSSLDHPFIVRHLGYFEGAAHAYLVQELLPGGDLYQVLEHSGPRCSEAFVRAVAAQVALVLGYLHKQRIVYRDLKPENLVLDGRRYVKLVDFGFARRVEWKTFTLCGSPEYLAPEMLRCTGHGRGVDAWALGVLIYELLCGYPPFTADEPLDIYRNILTGRVHLPRHLSDAARSLLRHLLVGDVTRRYGCMRRGMHDVLEHRFFDGLPINDIQTRSLDLSNL